MGANSPEFRKENLERELGELIDVKHMVEGELFQKYFATPMRKELKGLKDAYDCDSLKELHEIKGKRWGVNQFFKQVDELETRSRFIRNDLDKL